jgi:superfamily I DNA and/or RNA helicase
MKVNLHKNLILVKGEDKTEDIVSCKYEKGKYHIVYSNRSEPYYYSYINVQWLRNPINIDPNNIKIIKNGQEFFDVLEILEFENYLRVFFANNIVRSYNKHDLEIEYNCLANERTSNCFEYFKQIADKISIKTEDGTMILAKQYEKIKFISQDTVLAKYLNPTKEKKDRVSLKNVFFPFGCNLSQIQAVKKAFESSVSVIEGPPGTGKTQTILNIIANAVIRGKTVAVVSNNNSATDNVFEKLEKYKFDFIAAPLGKSDNKKEFILNQKTLYPNLDEFQYDANKIEQIKNDILSLENELEDMLASQNNIADLKRQLSATELEKRHFEIYFKETHNDDIKIKNINKLNSIYIMKLWVQCQSYGEKEKKLTLWFKFKNYIWYGISDFPFYKKPINQVIPAFQSLYYVLKINELKKEISETENKLEKYNFKEKLQNLTDNSIIVFKNTLYKKYNGKVQRKVFTGDDLWKNTKEVNDEYPIVLSTTHSIRSSLSAEHIFDYVIIDEASQVDLTTGVLALSCARNAIIVGDLKQLPNVVSENTRKITKQIFEKYNIHNGYEFATNSLLSSVCSIMPNISRTLLKEHYRCHPKIIEFCNQKFYQNQLVIMTEDNGENDVLKVYKTVSGNHSRDHFNQRQIDEIREYVIPQVEKIVSKNDIGIIAPYRKQTEELKKDKVSGELDISTVHKFQGREKEAIIISTVDNEISEFTDNPNMLNVAVSRAKKSLSIVISDNEKNESTNIGDLVKYVQYNNFEIVNGEVYSVFDLLYKDYTKQRNGFLKKQKRISEFDSENLMYALIEEVINQEKFLKYDVVIHQPLNMLIRDPEKLNDEECRYVMNSATHTDFLIYNKLDKMPALAIEVDGYQYHKEGTRQHERDKIKDGVLKKYNIPILRFRTNGSNERKQLADILSQII